MLMMAHARQKERKNAMTKSVHVRYCILTLDEGVKVGE
jgi:hypothetical protein